MKIKKNKDWIINELYDQFQLKDTNATNQNLYHNNKDQITQFKDLGGMWNNKKKTKGFMCNLHCNREKSRKKSSTAH